MGDSRIVKKFLRLLEECEEEHIFEGTIRELDTPIDYAKHLVRGMSVESTAELRKVRFAMDLRNEPYMKIGTLKVDDAVVIIGCQLRQKENETSPKIILLPKERAMILAREPEPIGWQGGWGEWGIVVSYVGAGVLGTIAFFMIFLLGNFDLYTFMPWIAGLYLFFFITIGIEWYSKFSRRERVINCDTKDWETITGEISEKYNIM